MPIRRVRARPLLLLAVVLGMFVAPTAAWALRVKNYMRSDISSTGDLAVYDYSTGTTTSYDTDANWDTGTYAGTEKLSGSVRAVRYGDAAPSSTNPWWDTSLKTRRCFTVTNPTASVATNSVAQITFDSTSDIASGWMLAAAADLRVASGGASPAALAFRSVGPWPSATSAVWVRIPSIAASSGPRPTLHRRKTRESGGWK